jgi:hypothetical protein
MKILLAASLLCGALQAAGPCSNATIKGDYGLLFSGFRPAGGPGGPIEDFVGLVFRRYDGAGNFTETHTIKGSISPLVLEESGIGTYQINADCSGSATILPVPSRPFPIVEQVIVVDDGDEILGVTPLPPALLTTSRQRKVSGNNGVAAGRLAAIQANIAVMARRLGLVPKE